MRRLVFSLLLLLCIQEIAGYDITGDEMKRYRNEFSKEQLQINLLQGAYGEALFHLIKEKDDMIEPMEALDLVKEYYAANFEKMYYEDKDDYYYKLSLADYYLVYEGVANNEGDYLIHLYEFVLDDPETGIGHTVTYGWYTVDKKTGDWMIQ